MATAKKTGQGKTTARTAAGAEKALAKKVATKQAATEPGTPTVKKRTAAPARAAKTAAAKAAPTPAAKKGAARTMPTRSPAPTKTVRAPAGSPARRPADTVASPRAPVAKKVPASGPLTLAEARALASARRPQAMAPRSASPVTTPPATPGSVAAERERLQEAQDAELARRLREYEATMSVLKQRGARSSARTPLPAGVARGLRPAPAGFVPLQVIAEGDSWFDYPPFAFKGGLVPRLERRLGVPILNLAKAGDEVRFMLGVKQYQLLTEHLRDGCPAGGAWDVLLFSGGGNDIVDNPMALWLKPWDATQPPEAHLNLPRFVSALALVRAGYEDLIALRDRLSPTTELVFHTYDYAIPDGRGVCFNAVGPWLKPAFDLRQFPNQQAASAVVRAMLTAFANELQALAAAHPKVTVVNGQGLLPASTSWWHNELHPSSAGYDRHAENFRATLQALFPTRVA